MIFVCYSHSGRGSVERLHVETEEEFAEQFSEEDGDDAKSVTTRANSHWDNKIKWSDTAFGIDRIPAALMKSYQWFISHGMSFSSHSSRGDHGVQSTGEMRKFNFTPDGYSHEYYLLSHEEPSHFILANFVSTRDECKKKRGDGDGTYKCKFIHSDEVKETDTIIDINKRYCDYGLHDVAGICIGLRIVDANRDDNPYAIYQLKDSLHGEDYSHMIYVFSTASL